MSKHLKVHDEKESHKEKEITTEPETNGESDTLIENQHSPHNPKNVVQHHFLGHHPKEHHHIVHEDSENIINKGLDEVKETKDPLLIYQTKVAEDYYALCWCGLKKDVWNEKEVYGVPISLTPSNYTRLIVDFIIFAILISFTISLLLYQVFSTAEFKIGSWRLEALKILLVGFAQKLLAKEVDKGSSKLRYALRHPEEFNYPYFAIFIPFWQIFMCFVSYILIVLYMCVTDKALPMTMHFAEVAILIELDDWIGEMICKEYPDEGEKPEDVSIDNLNEEMSLHMKLSLVREDLEIITDYNIPFESSFLKICSWFVSKFPWFLLPFISTLSFEYILVYYRPDLIEIV